jgi:hypothetical protein
MLSESKKRDVERGLLWIRLIWIALLVLVLFLGVLIPSIMWVAGTAQVLGSPDAAFRLVMYILYAIAAVLAVSVYLIRKAVLKPRETGSPVAQYAALVLIAGPLCLVIAIYGLITFLIGGSLVSPYALVVLSVAALLYIRPRKAELVTLVEHTEKDHVIRD